MIRIVRKVVLESLDDKEKQPFRLPIVPASGIVEIKESADEGGRLLEYNFSANLSGDVLPEYRSNLKIRIYFDDGRSVVLGNPDLPVRFIFDTYNIIKVTFKYRRPYRSVLSV